MKFLVKIIFLLELYFLKYRAKLFCETSPTEVVLLYFRISHKIRKFILLPVELPPTEPPLITEKTSCWCGSGTATSSCYSKSVQVSPFAFHGHAQEPSQPQEV